MECIVPAELNSEPYVYKLPASVSFTGKGLLGYTFGPLKQPDLEIYYVEVDKGHDVFMISKKVTRTYYVLEGSGSFTIDGRKYGVDTGMVVEVPPKVEYCYSGKMKLLVLSRPRWFSGNDTFTKWNPDVVGPDVALTKKADSRLKRLVRLRILGKSPMTAFRGINQWLWGRLPQVIMSSSPVLAYGHFLHSLSLLQEIRAQAFSTFFLRNRPQLELIRRLVNQKNNGETVRVAVLACSTGAEAYSVAWTIRSARPDLKLILNAVDISKQAVEFGERGVYSITDSQLSPTEILSRMTTDEVKSMFDTVGNCVEVKPWLKEGINWSVGDVGERETLEALGPQDIVVANNFICHMEAFEAESCLRNIARLVRPGGYLFVSGIDLDVRTKVARDLGWNPSQELLEESHEGDSCMRSYWPCHYAGLEPLDKRRSDWRTRYAAAFQVASVPAGSPLPQEKETATA